MGHAHSGYWRNFVLTSAAAELRNKFSMENPGPSTLLRSCSPRSGRGPQVVCVTESEEEAEGGLGIICQLIVVALSNCVVVVEFAVAICLALSLPPTFLPPSLSPCFALLRHSHCVPRTRLLNINVANSKQIKHATTRCQGQPPFRGAGSGPCPLGTAAKQSKLKCLLKGHRDARNHLQTTWPPRLRLPHSIPVQLQTDRIGGMNN